MRPPVTTALGGTGGDTQLSAALPSQCCVSASSRDNRRTAWAHEAASTSSSAWTVARLTRMRALDLRGGVTLE